MRDKAADFRRRAGEPGLSPTQVQTFMAGADKLMAQADDLERTLERMAAIAQDPAKREALLAELRVKRAKTQREQLKRRWGKTLELEAVKYELRRHARRTSRLLRIREFAREARDQASADRADKLLLREGNRHQTQMQVFESTAAQLNARALAAGASPGSAPGATPPASEPAATPPVPTP